MSLSAKLKGKSSGCVTCISWGLACFAFGEGTLIPNEQGPKFQLP